MRKINVGGLPVLLRLVGPATVVRVIFGIGLGLVAALAIAATAIVDLLHVAIDPRLDETYDVTPG